MSSRPRPQAGTGKQRLDLVDPDEKVLDEAGKPLDRAGLEAALVKAQRRLLGLRLRCGGQLGPDGRTPPGEGARLLGPGVLVLLEGWDASGKGGAIKRLIEPLDPRHVRVATFSAPTADEKRHLFLQRFVSAMPGRGGMTVLDRSWYGRVLVERIEGFAADHEWSRAYGEIAAFERMLAAEGTVIQKFWIHISKDEQLKRFDARAREPLKAWKLTPDDWRNRSRWDEYAAAVDDMLARTDTPESPWIVVPGNDKRAARLRVVESVVAAIEASPRLPR
jgi:polyphosphate kinase 2 (PPK2 family)